MTLNVSGRFATGFAWKNTLLSKNDRITLFKIQLCYTAWIFANQIYCSALKKYALSECGRRWYPFAIAQHIGAERS